MAKWIKGRKAHYDTQGACVFIRYKDYLMCDKCGYEFFGTTEYDHCPSCGADMRKDVKNDTKRIEGD